MQVLRTSLSLVALVLGAPAFARVPLGGEGEAPISEALSTLHPDVSIYNDHLVTLASPWMEGRVPGSRGMELAKEYCEYWYRQAGLEPAFDGSYRQTFELAATPELLSQSIEMVGEAPDGGALGLELVAGEEFNALSVGKGGEASGPLVFVGYSIERGPVKSDYRTYGENDDLTGRIALMLRFEPMDYKGKSQWGGSPWTARAGFSGKVRAAAKRGAAGILIVQTPGADDERINQLPEFRSAGGTAADIPIAMISAEAGERLLQAAGCPRSLMELRTMADEGGGLWEVGGEVSMNIEIDRTPLAAENVGALLPGKGALADELIVVGAHLDHLGMGNFGSRAAEEQKGKTLHPGADDNASGSAALLMLADKLRGSYDALPEDAEARSVLFLSFSGEESGLHGSRFYTNNMIRDVEQHALMINFDMIGRIVNGRLSVSGAQTGEGLAEFLTPYFENTNLDIVQPENLSGASDHTPFLRKDIPVLFGIIADFHDDYHTPRDTSAKINRVGAVETVHLFHEILLGAATRAERFAFQEPEQRGGRRARQREGQESEEEAEPSTGAAAPSRGGIRVRFGIAPGSYESDTAGVAVGSVTKDSSAAEAGVEAGDVLIKWNGEDIADIRAWMGMLARHEPGDKVQVTVLRDTEEKVLWVTLRGTGGTDQ